MTWYQSSGVGSGGSHAANCVQDSCRPLYVISCCAPRAAHATHGHEMAFASVARRRIDTESARVVIELWHGQSREEVEIVHALAPHLVNHGLDALQHDVRLAACSGSTVTRRHGASSGSCSMQKCSAPKRTSIVPRYTSGTESAPPTDCDHATILAWSRGSSAGGKNPSWKALDAP